MEQGNPYLSALTKKLGLFLSVFVFLLPVFFVPAISVSFYVAKIILLATGLVIIFAIYLSSVLSSGVIEIPKVKYLLPMAIFPLVAILSSVLSGNIGLSISGRVFDFGTSGFLVMIVFSLFMALVAVKNLGTVSKVIWAFIFSSLFLSSYFLLTTVFGSLLPAAIASRLPLFLSGGVIDTAVILGAAIILSLCVLNMSEVSEKMKYILYALIAFSLFFIGASNFTPVTVMLGVISLIFFVYILSWSLSFKSKIPEDNPENVDGDLNQNQHQERKVSTSSLIVLIISIFLLLGGSNISSNLSNALKINTSEIRPNFQTTIDLSLNAWKQNFALGIGPNNFADFWAKNKPIEINQTQFWSVDFYNGSGFLPTLAINTGLLGLLSLLVFLAMYLMVGIKAIFAQANAGKSRYLSTASFLVSVYFWVMLFLYTPSIVVLALTFIFTGIFTSTLIPQGIVGLWRVNIFSNPKTNFLSVLSIVIVLILSVAGIYFVWEKAIAAVTYQKGLINYQKTGDIGTAKQTIIRAINTSPNDLYWRAMAEIFIADLGRVIGGISDKNQITESVRAEIQNIIADAIQSSRNAISINDQSFVNWFSLGRVYEILAQNGIEGSLQSARDSYFEAATRSPNNPSVPLALARLDALSGKTEEAKNNITKSLELKNNYTDAYFFLAQLEAASNNIKGAIQSVEAATVIDPFNAGLHFQLGLLKYNEKDWKGAIDAFSRAISILPDYANARYFLGLSLYQLNDLKGASQQFEEIRKNNPENQELDLIISNIKSGKTIFADAQPPIDDQPEKRTEPPIEEN